MDRIVDRASGTAQFLDRVATSNLVLVSDELIHRLSEQVDGVKEIAFANYVDLDNITSTLVTPELKALQKELAKQKQTVIAVQALIKEMATSEGRRDPASALFVRLTKESPTTQIHGDTMLLQNNKEIDVLRETIKKMTEAEEYLKHSPKDEEQKLAHALLQSHIAQLRKIWEHEVKGSRVFI